MNFPKVQRVLGRIQLTFSGINTACAIQLLFLTPFASYAQLVLGLCHLVMGYLSFIWFRKAFAFAQLIEDLEKADKEKK